MKWEKMVVVNCQRQISTCEIENTHRKEMDLSCIVKSKIIVCTKRSSGTCTGSRNARMRLIVTVLFYFHNTILVASSSTTISSITQDGWDALRKQQNVPFRPPPPPPRSTQQLIENDNVLIEHSENDEMSVPEVITGGDAVDGSKQSHGVTKKFDYPDSSNDAILARREQVPPPPPQIPGFLQQNIDPSKSAVKTTSQLIHPPSTRAQNEELFAQSTRIIPPPRPPILPSLPTEQFINDPIPNTGKTELHNGYTMSPNPTNQQNNYLIPSPQSNIINLPMDRSQSVTNAQTQTSGNEILPSSDGTRLKTPSQSYQQYAQQRANYKDNRLPPQTQNQWNRRNSYEAVNNQQHLTAARQLQRSSQQKTQFTWKSMWGKVERSLDSLATIEDLVTDKVQKSFSSAVSAIEQRIPDTVLKISPPSFVKTNSNKINPRQNVEHSLPNSLRSSTLPPMQDSANIGRFASKKQTTIVGEQKRHEPLTAMTYRKWASRSPPVPSQSSTCSHIESNGPRKISWETVSGNSKSNGASSSASIKSSSGIPNTENTNSNPYTTFPSARDHHRQTDTAGSRRYWQNALQTGQDGVKERNIQPATSFFSNDDDDENVSLFQKVRNVIPRVPVLSSFQLLRNGGSTIANDATLDAWSASEGGIMGQQSSNTKSVQIGKSVPPSISSSHKKTKEVSQFITAPLSDLLERCQKEGKRVALLTSKDKQLCVSIGRHKASLDILALLFLVAALRSLESTFIDFPAIASWKEVVTETIPWLSSILPKVFESWFPYFAIASFFAMQTRQLVSRQREAALVERVSDTVRSETQYGLLFLRLLTSMNVDRSLPYQMEYATRQQILAKINVARSECFIVVLLLALVTMAASIFEPLVGVGLVTLEQIASMAQWHSSPFNVRHIADGLLSILGPALAQIWEVVKEELGTVLMTPFRYAFEASIFIALIVNLIIPKLEQARNVSILLKSDFEDDEVDDATIHQSMTEKIWNIGSSGSGRLGLLSVNGRVESLLERWRSMIPQYDTTASKNSWHAFFRLNLYRFAAALILASPVYAYRYLGEASVNKFSATALRWDNKLDVSIVLLFTQQLVWNMLSSIVIATEAKERVSGFVSTLVETIEERKKAMFPSSQDLKFQASISASAGVVVKDLWAAHTSKRAWAVRGATLNCMGGEVVVILGDDGAGKTRLLTAIAEALIAPATRSLTTQKVRGSISLGGVDVSKWVGSNIRRRVGIYIDDIASKSDLAQTMSGLTLEEILDPCDGLLHLDQNRSPGTSERSSMTLALKMTGLYSSLLPRLSSKMSTTISVGDDDIGQMLSPGEWSKLLLARTLAQVIYDNDNSLGTTDTVLNSLVGTLLLLDDVTLHLSEVEEASLIKDLRQSNAASVITSKRWATGRFADRVIVMKDGAVIESGSHSELLQMGPQQSVYAAKWFTMTNT